MDVTKNTVTSIFEFIGKRGRIVTNGMLVDVEIHDAKMAYGQVRFQVKPIAGSGFTWMNQASVQSITDASGKLVQ